MTRIARYRPWVHEDPPIPLADRILHLNVGALAHAIYELESYRQRNTARNRKLLIDLDNGRAYIRRASYEFSKLTCCIYKGGGWKVDLKDPGIQEALREKIWTTPWGGFRNLLALHGWTLKFSHPNGDPRVRKHTKLETIIPLITIVEHIPKEAKLQEVA